MPESIHNTTSTRAPSVFIVEDTTELAEVISATLERMNLKIATETHGGKALARYAEVDPDVILLDIGLPDITGWQFLEGIKETRKDTDKMPIVIVITAYGDPANRLVGKLQGVHDYLIKPFTADEVEKVVQRALSSKTQ
jgi:CheY-like chemotaxis protein